MKIWINRSFYDKAHYNRPTSREKDYQGTNVHLNKLFFHLDILEENENKIWLFYLPSMAR